MKDFIEDKKFKGEDFTIKAFGKGEYEYCIFEKCNFSEVHLTLSIFSECIFLDCNFSMTKVNNTAFKNVKFESCKLLGVNFWECNPFLLDLDFKNCQLDLASFYRLKLKGTKFLNCSLKEVDFSEADLTQADFETSDLQNAVFENTRLFKADVRKSRNFTINPDKNMVKNLKISRDGLEGLLLQFDLKIS